MLAKTSIPVLHSSAALLKIAEMDYNGANSIFMRVLLDKKYALPYRVVDAVVHHFIRYVFPSLIFLVTALECKMRQIWLTHKQTNLDSGKKKKYLNDLGRIET